MRDPDPVGVDRRSVLGEMAGCSGVVEVDVGEKHLRNIRRGEAEICQLGLQHRKGRPRSRFDECGAVVVGDQICRNGLWSILEVEVERVQAVHWIWGVNGRMRVSYIQQDSRATNHRIRSQLLGACPGERDAESANTVSFYRAYGQLGRSPD